MDGVGVDALVGVWIAEGVITKNVGELCAGTGLLVTEPDEGVLETTADSEGEIETGGNAAIEVW